MSSSGLQCPAEVAAEEGYRPTVPGGGKLEPGRQIPVLVLRLGPSALQSGHFLGHVAPRDPPERRPLSPSHRHLPLWHAPSSTRRVDDLVPRPEDPVLVPAGGHFRPTAAGSSPSTSPLVISSAYREQKRSSSSSSSLTGPPSTTWEPLRRVDAVLSLEGHFPPLSSGGIRMDASLTAAM